MKVLYLAPFYRFFIKDFVDNVAMEDVKAEVMIFHNIIYELHFVLPLKYFKCVHLYTRDSIAESSRVSEKVNLHIISYFNLVPNSLRIGDKLLKIALKYIKRKLNYGFDLIHAHFSWPYGYIGTKLAEYYDVPVVVTVHENRDWFLNLYNSKNERVKYCWKNADALIRVNKIDIPLLKEFNPNVYYIPNGFDPKRLHFMPREDARKRLALSSKDKIIFSLGVLIERKGFQFLIEAMSRVVEKREDVKCYIGGDGPLKPKLNKMIKNYNLDKNVILLGYINEEDLSYWMNSADLFVLPSLSEGNPTVMFEALGLGIPFVGTAVGGIPEIITSEDYGIIVEPANPNDLAEKILLALDKDWNREIIRRYGQAFMWSNIAKKVIEIYSSLLKSKAQE